MRKTGRDGIRRKRMRNKIEKKVKMRKERRETKL
jgi:hypothetical protein